MKLSEVTKIEIVLTRRIDMCNCTHVIFNVHFGDKQYHWPCPNQSGGTLGYLREDHETALMELQKVIPLFLDNPTIK